MSITKHVRVDPETLETLKQIAKAQGEAMPKILARAVDEFKRNHFFDELDAAYAELEKSGGDADYRREVMTLESGSIVDGMEVTKVVNARKATGKRK